MDNEIIKNISELKWEMKYVSNTLTKVEKAIENQAVLLEKQNVANQRILNLEKTQKENREMITNLEKWQIKVVTVASIIAWIVWFILNKIF